MSGAEFELLRQNTIWLRDHCAFLNKRIKELEAGLDLAPNIAEALRSADWSGVSIGNKVLIAAAIEQLEKVSTR